MSKNSSHLAWAGAGAAIGLAFAGVLLHQRPALDLRGKVVLITGGSRGLGIALAREFAGRECAVAICARNKEEVRRASEEFESRGDRFLACECDLTDPSQVATMINEVESKLGAIDVLVNNAGVIQVGPLRNQSLQEFRAAMDGNFWSAVHTCLELIPRMAERGRGSIVNISSVGGVIGVPHLLPYCASKFALSGFSAGLRTELARDGIRVTTVIPGLMRTGSPRNIDVKGDHASEYAWFILSDSLPGMSMDVRKAARLIVEACAAGKSEIILGLPAKFATLVKAAAPEAFYSALAAVNSWLLPKASGDQSIRKGFQSESRITLSPLTATTRKAEARNNELVDE